jgi:hypothetical protein
MPTSGIPFRGTSARTLGDTEIRAMLEQAWDDGNASGLDGFTGPGRGTLPIDDQAIFARDRVINRILVEFRSGVPAEELLAIPKPWFLGDGVLLRHEPFGTPRQTVRVTGDPIDEGVARRYTTTLVDRARGLITDTAISPTLIEAIRRAEEWIP